MLALTDIEAAAQRIRPFVRQTPLERSRTLSERFKTNVYVKLELFQQTGSFKPRGALNQFLALSEAERARGVVGLSGGNFAQGAAYAGQILGVKTRIVMPEGTPANYVEATRSYGAEVVFASDVAQAFERVVADAEAGWTVVHPYDHPAMMAGNGSLGLEIAADLPDVSDVLVSIGGGGLIAGVASALKHLEPEAKLWGVETEGADAMARSLAAGEVVSIRPTSLARTLGAPHVSETAFSIVREAVEDVVVVPDAAAFEALRFLMERLKIVPELAAACTLAAADRLEPQLGEHGVLLICGGNVSLADLCAYRQSLSN